jgi:hypothetical protein
MTSPIQRAARLGRRDGRSAFFRRGTGIPVQPLSEAWLAGTGIHEHDQQQVYLHGFRLAFLAAVEGWERSQRVGEWRVDDPRDWAS